jgi:hypothetical protein
MTAARRVLLLCLACALLAPATALAQGAFAGVVKDASGSVLPGVTVEARSNALIEGARSVVTDGNGQYRVVDLRPGTYTLVFTLPGFSSVRREGLELTGARVVNIDAQLAVGGVQETVTVTGETPVVDIQSSQRQAVMSDEIIAALPAGRSHYDLAALVPGLVGQQFGRAGWQDVGGTNNLQISAMSIHGGTFLDTTMAVNGLSSRNLLSTNWATNFVADTGTAAEWTIDYAGQGAESASSGVTFNMIPKEGGNRFSGSIFATGANEHFQANNYTDELKARGLRSPSTLFRMYDVNPSGGGPILPNKLWFYVSGRWQTNQTYIPGSVGNANAGDPTKWLWVADPSVRGKFNTTQNSGSFRVTYQAGPKNKFFVSHEPQGRTWIDATAATSPESFTDYVFTMQRMSSAGWTGTLTNKLLATVKWGDHGEAFGDQIPSDAPYNTLITVHEVGGQFIQPQHYRGRGHGGNQAVAPGYHTEPHDQQIAASLSYVTGSHNLKFGVQDQWGTIDLFSETVPANVDYYFVNGVPSQVRQWALPIHTANKLSAELGLYAQDAWTIKRATINMGLRFDYFKNSFPEQTLGPGLFVPNRNVTFAPASFYSMKDLTPRIGIAYDLFGNGKTALKAHWGKYVQGLSAGTGNPVGNLSTNATRTWTDANGNFNVDCDLKIVAAQDLRAGGGDFCGPNPNALFGLSTPSTAYDEDVYKGWGNRQWNQTFSLGVQHEVAPRVSVDVSYYRRWAGNFQVTDNRAVEASDYTKYSIVAPSQDAFNALGAKIPLPNGAAGRTTSGFYDLNPNKVGQVNNLITLARKFGDQYEHWNGVDFTINARMSNGLTVQGGVSTGRQVTDNCEIRAALPESARDPFTFNPTPDDYCHVVQSLQTQTKLLGTYLVPKVDVQIAATFQNNPGYLLASNYNMPVGNIVGLGRPLSNGSATVNYNLLVPNTVYGPRTTQLDLRMSKIFRMRGTRASINFDLANLLNRNDILGVSTTYGAAWQTPTTILDPRLFKLGVQFDF